MHRPGANGKPSRPRYARVPAVVFEARVNLEKLACMLGRPLTTRDRGVRLRPIEVAVYAALALHADKAGRCYPSRRTVAATLGVTERHVSAALLRLWAAGVLAWDRRATETGDPQHRVNCYTLPDVTDTHKRRPEAGFPSGAQIGSGVPEPGFPQTDHLVTEGYEGRRMFRESRD